VISAVVVTHESAACIAGCLTSVARTFPDAEVVVVDNDSHDRTVDIAASTMDAVRVIELRENVGFGRACNIGANIAAQTHVLFLNPDTRVAEVDRNALGELLARRPFGLVAPWLDDEHERRRIESHWLPDLVLHTVGTLRPRESRPRVRHSSNDTRVWVGGAMLLVARDEFLTIGGFDPRFFLYYEDRDLSRRYRESGFPITTTDALRGVHKGGASSTQDGLRAGPLAWALLGWIQYVSIYNGSRAARRSAWAALSTLRVTRAALRVIAATGWRRARRKKRQLEEMLHFIDGRANADDGRFCPDALEAMRRLT
jgi:N-acetylglucosaminyl-diphospho-decaprenol L-rhamnosyltransferase